MSKNTSFLPENVTNSDPVNHFDRFGFAKMPYTGSIALLGFLLNSIQVYVFVSMKKLSFSNVLFLSIAISDAMFSAVVVPLATVNTTFPAWPLGAFMCYLNIIYLGVNFFCTNYWVMMLSLNRCLHIVRPYQDHEVVSAKKLAILFAPILAILAYNVVTLSVQLGFSTLDLPSCTMHLSLLSLISQIVLIYGSPIVLNILVNVVSMVLLYRKRLKVRPKLAILSPIQTESASRTGSNLNPASLSTSCAAASVIEPPVGLCSTDTVM